MSNTLHYSPESVQDLDEIFEYIAVKKQNPIAARNTVQGIRAEISKLKTLDNIGVRVFLPNSLETPYRFIKYNNYLSFYRHIETDVYIDRIIYGKRDYIQILFGADLIWATQI